jgi:glycosyltransferase involved in cell wall biosynthesis
LIDLNHIKFKALEQIQNDTFVSEKFTIISVGRLDPVKRFESIPYLAKYLVDNNCDFRWYIIGPKSSEDVYKQINEEIDRNNVSDYVFYLGNKYNPYPYIAQSDLLVALSFSEACPMIFNEAKVLGVPVLTTDFGSAAEFIEDGNNGYIVPFNQINIYLYKLLKSKQIYISIKDGMTQNEYNNKLAIQQLLDLFK